jgi:hypothetical protein
MPYSNLPGIVINAAQWLKHGHKRARCQWAVCSRQ